MTNALFGAALGISIYFTTLRLIVCGDFYQLPPVPNRRYYDKGDFCFYSKHFPKLHRVTLLEVVRQNDQVFVEIIHKVALGGEIDMETSKFIKALDRPLNTLRKAQNYMQQMTL